MVLQRTGDKYQNVLDHICIGGRADVYLSNVPVAQEDCKGHGSAQDEERPAHESRGHGR